jgi:uncharacterized membrane protein YbhN (UPF0104 family)
MKVGTRWLLGAKLAFSAMLVVAVLHRVSYAEVIARISTANPFDVMVCLLIAVPTMALSAWRWQMLAQGILSFPAALKYILIGLFYGSILPGAVSGDIARGVALAVKEKAMRVDVLPASILVDRLIGLAALFFIAAIGFLLMRAKLASGLEEYQSMALFGTALSAGIVMGVACAFTPWFAILIRWMIAWIPMASPRAVVERVLAAVVPYTVRPGLLLGAFVLSLLVHMFTIFGYMIAFRAFGIDVTPLTATIFFSCLSVILLLPISISGIGVREVFSIFFFKTLHASAEQAVAFSWLLLFLGLVVAIVGAGMQIWELCRPSNPCNKAA